MNLLNSVALCYDIWPKMPYVLRAEDTSNEFI